MNYLKIYNEIIENRKLNKYYGYTEMHHIIPRCMNGTDDKENLVALSAREHFICHLLLTKIYPKNTDLVYAFNNMFMSSDNQERYLPSSHWYEYKRVVFVKNHPMKDPLIKEKHRKNSTIGTIAAIKRKALKWVEENPGSFCELNTCDICGKITNGNKRKYCSDNCRLAKIKKPTKPCLVCGRHHNKVYCCSKECMDKYKKQPDDEYSKTLSIKRKKYIKENADKIKIASQKAAKNVDQEAKGKKNSRNKKEKRQR